MKNFRSYAMLLPLLGITSGCTNSGASLFQTLATDPADACGIVTNTLPPYGGVIVFARSNSANGSQLSVKEDGSCSITRNAPGAIGK